MRAVMGEHSTSESRHCWTFLHGYGVSFGALHSEVFVVFGVFTSLQEAFFYFKHHWLRA